MVKPPGPPGARDRSTHSSSSRRMNQMCGPPSGTSPSSTTRKSNRELFDGKHAGIAVTTGARISSLAGPSQVLVSQTVRDLVAGSGFAFHAAGEHDLKGVSDRSRVYAVA
jgi:class 3 adenylate cyclase